MQSGILAEWSWQAMDPSAAPAAFKDIFIQAGRKEGKGGVQEEQLHIICCEAQDGKKMGGWMAGRWGGGVIYYPAQGEETNPCGQGPTRQSPKCQGQDMKRYGNKANTKLNVICVTTSGELFHDSIWSKAASPAGNE